jgi:hypothetical protein
MRLPPVRFQSFSDPFVQQPPSAAGVRLTWADTCVWMTKESSGAVAGSPETVEMIEAEKRAFRLRSGQRQDARLVSEAAAGVWHAVSGGLPRAVTGAGRASRPPRRR